MTLQLFPRVMCSLRCIVGWMLLATVVVGSVLGPTVHRAQHAMERIETRSESPCHSPAVHYAEDPVWTHPGPGVAVPDCDLCATRLLVVPSELEPIGTALTVTSNWRSVGAHRISVFVVPAPLIRGPPNRS